MTRFLHNPVALTLSPSLRGRGKRGARVGMREVFVMIYGNINNGSFCSKNIHLKNNAEIVTSLHSRIWKFIA